MREVAAGPQCAYGGAQSSTHRLRLRCRRGRLPAGCCEAWCAVRLLLLLCCRSLCHCALPLRGSKYRVSEYASGRRCLAVSTHYEDCLSAICRRAPLPWQAVCRLSCRADHRTAPGSSARVQPSVRSEESAGSETACPSSSTAPGSDAVQVRARSVKTERAKYCYRCRVAKHHHRSRDLDPSQCSGSTEQHNNHWGQSVKS